MRESKQEDALPNKEQEPSASITPPQETLPQPEIKKPLYTVTVFDSEGKITTCETDVRPILRVYRYKKPKGDVLGKYGDLAYCPSVKKSETEPLFFRTVADAVRLDFAPCNNCWVNPDFGDLAVSRWFEYLRACKFHKKEPIAPIPKLQKILPANPEGRPEDQIKQILADSLHGLSDIAPENVKEIRKRTDEALKAVGSVSEEDESAKKVFTSVLKLREEGKWSELKNPYYVDELVFWSVQTEQEKLMLQMFELSNRFGFDGKKTNSIMRALCSKTQMKEKRENEILTTVTELCEKITSQETIPLADIRMMSALGIKLYDHATVRAKKALTELNKTISYSLIEKNRTAAALLRVIWIRESTSLDRKGGRLNPKESVKPQEEVLNHKYLPDLLKILTQEQFDAFGKFILYSTDQEGANETLDEYLEEYADKLDPSLVPYAKEAPEILTAMLSAFEEAGVVNRSTTGIIRLFAKASEGSTTYHYLLQFQRAQKRFDQLSESLEYKPNGTMKTLDDVIRIYSQYNEHKKMLDIPIFQDSDTRRILHISDVNLGHQDTAVDFILRTIKAVKALPAEKRPQAIVVNHLLSGAFENRGKNMKPALIPQFEDLEEQVKAGRILLDELKQLGVPVVLNLGTADWEIARDLVLRMLRYQQDLVGDNLSWSQQDEMQRSPEWSPYDRFIVDVGLPYCLREGEILSAYKLLVLFDISQELDRAEAEGRDPIISQEYRAMFDMDLIPKRGRLNYHDNLYITDNPILSSKNPDDTHKAYLYDDFNFSLGIQPPLYGDAIQSLQTRVIQALAMGTMRPGNTYTLSNQGQFTAISLDGDNTWVESMPSSRKDEFLETRGSRKRTYDAPRRQATTRRQIGSEAVILSETSTDSKIYHPYIPILMDLATTADRTTVIFGGDEQLGSDTERPELLVKALDIVTQKLPENKVLFLEGGDFVQGWNYKQKAQQEKAVGMQISIDDQVKLFKYLLYLSFKHVTNEHFQNLTEVKIIPGNHEMNSGWAWSGSTYLQPIAEEWNMIAAEKGSKMRTHVSENVVTPDGSFFQGFMIQYQVGGYKGILQHFPLKKGGKGQGSLPVYQTWPLLHSMIEQARDINFFNFQHNHHSAVHQVGNKIATIGPSKASQSEFEHYLGYRSIPGMGMLHLGGGEVPAVEFLSPNALLNHKMSEDSFFSDSHLRDLGFETDPNFNPVRDGFIPWTNPYDEIMLAQDYIPITHPQSALQKYIYKIGNPLPLQAHTKTG